jgi:hypothetical protein
MRTQCQHWPRSGVPLCCASQPLPGPAYFVRARSVPTTFAATQPAALELLRSSFCSKQRQGLIAHPVVVFLNIGDVFVEFLEPFRSLGIVAMESQIPRDSVDGSVVVGKAPSPNLQLPLTGFLANEFQCFSEPFDQVAEVDDFVALHQNTPAPDRLQFRPHEIPHFQALHPESFSGHQMVIHSTVRS